MERKRSITIIAIGVIEIIAGLVGVIIGLFWALFMAAHIVEYAKNSGKIALSVIMSIPIIIVIVLGPLALLICGFNFLKLKRWARVLSMVILALTAIIFVSLTIISGISGFSFSYSWGVNIVICVYYASLAVFT